MTKTNVTIQEFGSWDDYAKSDTNQILAKIYSDACQFSKSLREWYWTSIRAKRLTSIAIRGVSFWLLVLGALLPLMAALFASESYRLLCTQVAVGALALAGLLQAADKVFGWSSGWLRYITTVTAMESTTRQFQIDWAKYVCSNASTLGNADQIALFELANKFAGDLARLRDTETTSWVAEFNTGQAALSDLIRSQRDAADKLKDAAVQSLDAQQAQADARAKALQCGSIQLTLAFPGAPCPVLISLDDAKSETYLGTLWSITGVAPGHHTLTIGFEGDEGPKVRTIADVKPDDVVQLSVTPPVK